MNDLIIRSAAVSDAAEILSVYAPYVENTAITFEYELPTLEEFEGRIRRTLEKYPYIVAVRDGGIVGYAYAGVFHERAAYDWAVETSIYVRIGERRSGIGSALYAALEKRLGEMGIINLYACIAVPEQDDEYLNRDSVYFHERLGYTLVGEFRQCGYKFKRWYSMVWMEKCIGEHLSEQPPVAWNKGI